MGNFLLSGDPGHVFTNIPVGDNNMTITCTSTSSGATLSSVLLFTIMGKDMVTLLYC